MYTGKSSVDNLRADISGTLVRLSYMFVTQTELTTFAFLGNCMHYLINSTAAKFLSNNQPPEYALLVPAEQQIVKGKGQNGQKDAALVFPIVLSRWSKQLKKITVAIKTDEMPHSYVLSGGVFNVTHRNSTQTG